MKTLRIITLAWLLAEMALGQNHPHNLKLDVQVLSQCYDPASDPRIGAVQLKTDWVFRNDGADPLIVPKNENYDVTLLISKTREDAMAGRFEYSGSFEDAGNWTHVPLPDKKMNPSEFQVLAPGASTKQEKPLTVFMDATPIHRRGAVPPGEHYLQVRVHNWVYSNRVGLRYRKLWRKFGTLVFEPVTSEPLRIELAPRSSSNECKGGGKAQLTAAQPGL